MPQNTGTDNNRKQTARNRKLSISLGLGPKHGDRQEPTSNRKEPTVVHLPRLWCRQVCSCPGLGTREATCSEVASRRKPAGPLHLWCTRGRTHTHCAFRRGLTAEKTTARQRAYFFCRGVCLPERGAMALPRRGSRPRGRSRWRSRSRRRSCSRSRCRCVSPGRHAPVAGEPWPGAPLYRI